MPKGGWLPLFALLTFLPISRADLYRSGVDFDSGSDKEHIYRCKYLVVNFKAHILTCLSTDVALMRFFGGLNTPDSLPRRQNLDPRRDDRSLRVCRTVGDFAVYMHDFGFEHFDINFREDADCWNGTSITNCGTASQTVQRGYTWWCNKRPNNPCVFNCPTQVSFCYLPLN